MKPSISRDVHYVSYGTPGGEYIRECRDDPEERVGLCAMNPSGLFFNRGVKHDEGKAGGTWHWPERIPE